LSIGWKVSQVDQCVDGHVYFVSVVDFACEEDMKKAIKKLDGTELMGRRVKLSEV
jgi:hypothetical protein